jgi:hypothetical protein
VFVAIAPLSQFAAARRQRCVARQAGRVPGDDRQSFALPSDSARRRCDRTVAPAKAAMGTGGQLEDQANAVRRMRGLIYGNWQTCITFAFAELAVADLLEGGALTVAELASATGTHPRSLQRFLRCCAQLGFVQQAAEDGEVALTAFGALLSSDHPLGQRDAARLNGAFYRYEPWGRLVDILRSGSGACFSPTHAEGSLDFLQDKPDMLAVFQRAMNNLSVDEDDLLAGAYDFNRFRHVVDVGGGHGNFLRAILRTSPDLRGTLFDLKASLATADGDAHAPADRLQRVAGDFFASVPADGDVYTLKNVLHNWPEERVRQILGTVRAAIGADGDPAGKRVLVIEHVMDERADAPGIAPWIDLNFFILVGGEDRTLRAYRALFEQCGFVVERVLPTPTGRTIIELSAS